MVYLIEPEDLVATVSGDMKLKDFDKKLIERCLISSLSAPEDYTIAQILAEDWGHDTRQVLGLELQHSDGSITKTGGKVIKNVSGYDLSKLYIGSNNSLVEIKAANLRLQKLPSQTCSFELELKQVDSDLIYFLHKITTIDFDDSCDSEIKFGQHNSLRVCFSANSDELLELKQKRMLNRFEEFGLQWIEPVVKPYIKEYPDAKLRLECHTVLSELLPLAKSLGACSLYPKRGYVLLDFIPEKNHLQNCFCYLYGFLEELNDPNNSEVELFEALKLSLRGFK